MQENTRMDDEIEIDLRELFGVILHWFWMIAICAVIAGGIGFAVSKFGMTPKYDSTTKILVLSNNSTASTNVYTELQVSSQLVKDYPDIIKSRTVLEEIIVRCNLKDTYKQLYDRVTVASSSDSRIISITVKDESPVKAKEIADAVREVASARIQDIMDIDAVNTVDEANLPVNPSEPSVIKITLIAAILGGFACAGVVVVRFLLDDTIKISEDIEKYLGLSSLGMIPDGAIKEKKSKRKTKK